MKDARYHTAKVLIEHKHILNFSEIFKTLPKSILARDIGTNNNRISRLIMNPLSCTIADIYAIAKLMDLPPVTVAILMFSQIDQNEKGKSRE